MNGAAWTGVGTVAAALLLYLGSVFTARASKDASRYSATLTASDNIATGYNKLNADLWEAIADLRQQVSDLKKEMERTNTKYGAAIIYIRQLLRFINLQGHEAPVPPPELDPDLKEV